MAIELLQERVQTDFVRSQKEISDFREQIAKFNSAYDNLDETAKEMRTGRSQRIEQDLQSRKAVVEMGH